MKSEGWRDLQDAAWELTCNYAVTCIAYTDCCREKTIGMIRIGLEWDSEELF